MTGPLQFDAAEPQGGGAAALTCVNCSAAIIDAYHMMNRAVLCERCRRALEQDWQSRLQPGRLGPALVMGLGGGIVGALLYYAVLALTGYEIGLIAIAVGWLVGRGVRKGSGEVGGRRYQVLAVLITYFAIVSTYVPFIVRGVDQEVPFLFVAIIALAGPFLAGIKNVIGMLIIGFALYQAWIMNRKADITFSGPFKVGAAAP